MNTPYMFTKLNRTHLIFLINHLKVNAESFKLRSYHQMHSFEPAAVRTRKRNFGATLCKRFQSSLLPTTKDNINQKKGKNEEPRLAMLSVLAEANHNFREQELNREHEHGYGLDFNSSSRNPQIPAWNNQNQERHVDLLAIN